MRDSPDQVLDVRSLIHAKQVRQIRYVKVGVANALHDAAIVKFVTLAAKLERRNGANPTPIEIPPELSVCRTTAQWVKSRSTAFRDKRRRGAGSTSM